MRTMRLLVLGGSWFLGRAIVAEAIRCGWDVSTFNRGTAPPPRAVTTIPGDRERSDDLARLARQGPWDAVIDVAGSVPAVARDSAKALSGVVDRYVFISTISAYRAWPHAPVDENSALWECDPDLDPGTRTWDPDAYGPLKVGCELAVHRFFDPERVLVIRPHVVLGPYEYVGRLPWWLTRMRRGGKVLAPGPDRAIQPIDVRDLAVFTLGLVARNARGAFNAAASGRDSYGGMLAACADAAATPADVVWVNEDWLVAQGVTQWTELPLWRNASAPWAMSTVKATEAGLTCRPLAETVADTWAWLAGGGEAVPHQRANEHGMSPDRERHLLRLWAAHSHVG